MWQWHLWAGPGGLGVWVSTGAVVGQGDQWWPPLPGSGLAGSTPGPTSCRWSPLWAALSGSGCCSTTSPAQPLGEPAGAQRRGCRTRRQSCADAALGLLAERLCGSAGRSGLSLATIFVSGCPGHLFPEFLRSCFDKKNSNNMSS